MMSRRNTIRLFLGLIEGRDNGAINDVLWMHGGNETIWEALLNEMDPGAEDSDRIVERLIDGGDDSALKAWLIEELRRMGPAE